MPVVPTRFVAPGDPLPELEGEVVVKPVISAGGRDTGRFGPEAHDEARALLARLGEAGREAMVQPYLAAVDTRGESALVHVAGEFSHGLRKLAVLRPDEVAPIRDDALARRRGDVRPRPGPGARRRPRRSARSRAGSSTTSPSGSARCRSTPASTSSRARTATPVLIELEVVEPNLYLHESPETAERLAEAIVAELDSLAWRGGESSR